MSITITKLCPHITATAVDLASVTSIAEKIVPEEGAAERIKVAAADAVKGPLPGTYDAAVLKSVLQVLSAQDARRAIQNVYDVLNPGGKLFIIGQILDDSRLSPLEAVGSMRKQINLGYPAETIRSESRAPDLLASQARRLCPRPHGTAYLADSRAPST